MDITKLIKKFKVEGEVVTSNHKHGEGRIHSTEVVVLDNTHKYILQRINHHVFPNVEGLMNNIIYVTEFIQDKVRKQGRDPRRKTLNLVNTVDNKPCYYVAEEDAYYRVYEYIKDSIEHQSLSDPEDFYWCGRAFGSFALLLSDFDATKLVDVIPNFHNTKVRYEHLLEVINKDEHDLVKTAKEEIEFVMQRAKDTEVVVNLLKDGTIPTHVTHNDPKLNNILFDSLTGKPLCVIDLDTVMSGSLLYDYGDAIRYGANLAGEDEQDLSKVHFDLEYFKAFSRGYINKLGENLTEKEKEYLPEGIKTMTLELGIRFLDDYLNGSKYFGIDYPTHNLIRARVQLKLVKEIEEKFDEMKAYVLSCK